MALTSHDSRALDAQHSSAAGNQTRPPTYRPLLSRLAWLCSLFGAERLDRDEIAQAVETPEPATVHTTDDLISQMLREQRYALLLRPEIVENLTSAQRTQAREQLLQQMSLVPQGEIRLGRHETDGDFDAGADLQDGDSDGIVVRVDAFVLDRTCVTNRQYQAFVDAGGYEQMAFWEPEIWPGVLDFVDQTGHPGPRFWRHGKFVPSLADHPVVGVSWYEAVAYARWAGKRLPTDPEWEKAAAWPVQMTAGRRPARRYPWGDSLEKARANLWLANIGGTTPVDSYPDGASIGGILQLIGNVWEWTSSNFGAFAQFDDELVLPSVLKGVRGGAFDTYFEAHATCQFQSGEDPTARLPNIGFRCAVSLCDLMLDGGHSEAEQTAETWSEDEHFAAEVPV